jgi:tyrosyl-tRNA synthetase
VRRFTVARLLERDDFEARMKEGRPVSALELFYPVLQGFDSVAIGADVELGGTDQKFNLLFARDVQQALGKPPQSILTMPILPGLDGVRRMSKSLGNYVGVTDPPEEMFGKLMSIPDDAMGEYRRLLLREGGEGAGAPVEAKRELARRLVERFHGADSAVAAEDRFDRVHVAGGVPDEIPEVDPSKVGGAATGKDGDVHLPALIGALSEVSNSEARRLIAQGGASLDGEVLSADRLDLPVAELSGKVLQVGKRRFWRFVDG